MERLSERLTSVEAILKKLDPIESLLEIYIPPNRCLPSKRLVCISEYPRVCCTS